MKTSWLLGGYKNMDVVRLLRCAQKNPVTPGFSSDAH